MPLFGRLSGLLRAAEGVSAVEFAIAAPLFLVVVIPLVDLGLGLDQKMQVSEAAEAGAQYALLHGWNGDPTPITNAAKNATSLTISASANESCGCPNGSSVVASSCGQTACSGGPAGYYVTVSTSATYTPILTYLSLGSSVTLNGQSTVRLE